MTQEEKAKRYDEALERARKFATDLPNGRNDRLYHVWDLESIFPELKESEDEKWIPKEIAKYLVEKGDFRSCWLAWLEKQGEQNEKMKKDIAEFIFNSREDIKHRYDWIKCLGYDIHFIDKERQCEQKPNPVLDIEIPFGAKDSELQEVSYHIPEGFHAEIEDNKVIIKKGKQNPAWSEEDEKVLHAIRNALNYEKPRNYLKSRDFEFTDILDWLKSLKDRVQPQQKQEWSEEDSEHLDSIIESYKDLIADYKASHDVDYIPCDSNTVVRTVTNDVNFLETLKDRYTWKPSDEQMKALDIAIRCGIQLGTWEEDALKSLKEQLKKLID